MELRGQIEEIIFSNELNGYTVCSMEVDGSAITITGNLPFVNIGDLLVVNGSFVNHNIYGKQFKVDEFEKAMPSSKIEIEKYLGSGIIKGVGPATSKKIVNKFGDESLQVLQHEPKRLAEIKGINFEKACEISESFNNAWGLWQILMFLKQYGIGTVNANKIYKIYGMNSINAIKENPYVLLDMLYGMNFGHIDKIAMSLGFELNSPYRIASGIKYALTLAIRNGHTCVLETAMIEYVADMLSVSEDLVENELTALKFSKKVYAEDDYIFLEDYFLAEENVAKKLLMLSRNFSKKYKSLNERIKEAEEKFHIELSKEQREAIKACFENQVVIITGGPGTGKTTIIKVLTYLLKQIDIEVALCAPTGRAARRMKETTGEEAKTLHKLLEISKIEDDTVNINFPVNKIRQNVVIIDEMSMVDIVLMNYLVKGLEDNSKLILIGDSDQLASVGPGSVLKDLIESGAIVTKKLTEIYRQAAESQIITNAHKINEGSKELSFNKKEGDFFFIRENDIIKQIVELVDVRLPKMRKV